MLAERTLFLAELVEVLLGNLASEELPVLERAVRACYAGAGISDDPDTHTRPAPLLSDLASHLATDGPVCSVTPARCDGNPPSPNRATNLKTAGSLGRT